MHALRLAPSAKTTPRALKTRVALPSAGKTPAPSAILPRADSTPPVKGQHGPRGAAAPNGLGFEPWTAERSPADKRYNRIDAPGSMLARKESPPHPDTRPKETELVHRTASLVRNSFAHLNLNT